MITFGNHAFKGLDEALEGAYAHLTTMHTHLLDLVALLPRGLEVIDKSNADAARAIDRKINLLEQELDTLAAQTLGKFTLSNEDLRYLLSALKVAGHLERAGDKLKNCVKRLSKRTYPVDEAVKHEITHAIDSIKAMFPVALGLVLNYDAEASSALLRYGARAQQSYRQVLIHLYHQQSAPSFGDHTHVLLVAKNLDQAADMAVEIMKVCHRLHLGKEYEAAKD